MSIREIPKRLLDYVVTYRSQIAFASTRHLPYSYYANSKRILKIHSLPGITLPIDWKKYQIYARTVDLTQPIDWYFSDEDSGWPKEHYAKINYRPGNPYGDIRINWELNRLQFLPLMAFSNRELAAAIIADWLNKNPYLQGPSYCSPMEVALRWISIYWTVCLLKKHIDDRLLKEVEGFGVASGNFIEKRLSTHSSAGNHLIIEATGLFWVGKALEATDQGQVWLRKARAILWAQLLRQTSPDGVGREQSYWYLGFILDAILHYLLLEDRDLIPEKVISRIEAVCEFLRATRIDDHAFFDYGDRDDGFVFRASSDYSESYFADLIETADLLLTKTNICSRLPSERSRRFQFWSSENLEKAPNGTSTNVNRDNKEIKEKKSLKTFLDGGITVMTWGKGKLFFRHARLGIEPTYAHGHADALAVLFFWGNTPVLVDTGTGQYNKDEFLRNYFRSTLAHNTIQIEGKNQAEIISPYMWNRSYDTKLSLSQDNPFLAVEACHTGYEKQFRVIHTRKVEWQVPKKILITDRFLGPHGPVSYAGAFHLGTCLRTEHQGNHFLVDYVGFRLSIGLPPEVDAQLYYGSKKPFVGWLSPLYGEIEPISSVIFSSTTTRCAEPRIMLEIEDS